jgi:N-acetylglucosamine-6-sulfatase
MGRASAEPRPGFDHWVSFRGQGVYYNPTLNVNGETVEREGYMTDLLTDYALDWLRQREGNEAPFFLYLSHKAVHADFQPAERHRGHYADVEPDYPPSMANVESNYRNKPDWVREQRFSWHGVDHLYHGRTSFDSFYRRYAETLLALDESIGQVLDYLDASGLAENTLVVYMGDNGFLLGEHGLIDKRNAYEESIRVPMLAWAPGFIAPGTTVDAQVRNIDVTPTILELADAAMPDDHTLDGQSFLSTLQGTEPETDRTFLYEYYWEYAFPHTPTVFALRTDQYKYIYYHGIWDLNGFYDLQNDPNERQNLINVPSYQDEIRSMRNELWQRLEDSGGLQIPLRPSGSFQAGERLLDRGSNR